MSQSNDSVVKNTKEVFQKQKLHIEELLIDEDFDTFEKDLKIFLSRYGKIIDMKILQNRKLSRATEALCLCDLPGRR